MSVRIDLLPPELLGRRFQYALFSAYPEIARPNYASGYVELPRRSDYAYLVVRVLEAVVSGLTWQKGEPGDTVEVDGLVVECGRLDQGPLLYTAGVNDRRILEAIYREADRLGAPKCYYTTKQGKRIPAWAHAAVTYAAAVARAGGPLGGRVDRMPSLASASVFSKLRAPGASREIGKRPVSLDVLGTVLLGGAAAFAGRESLGGDSVELYLLPDSIHEGYWLFREIAMLGGRADNLAVRAVRLVRELGVSLEPALSLEAAVALGERARQARELAPIPVEGLLSAARLYMVGAGGKRPMVREGILLSDLLYRSFSGGLLRLLEGFARRSLGRDVQRDEGASRRVAGTCISALFHQAMDPCNPEHAYTCARTAIAYALSDKSHPSLREPALGLARLVERDVSRLARESGCQP